MHEYQACVAAGLDLWAWEQGDYPPWFKANVLVWYQRDQLVKQHREDARAQAAKRKLRRRKR